jgi:uncharacterized membrane protein YdjX (TVP38/TMEM64 family)
MSDINPESPLEIPPQRPHLLGRAGIVALYATVVPILGSVVMLIGGPIYANWLDKKGVIGAIYFSLTFMVLGTIAFAPTYTTAVIAGYAFGFKLGFPAVVIGTVGGAMCCYFFARLIGGDRVAQLFASHPKWDIVRTALVCESKWKTLWIVILLRLSPALPFGTTNVLLATTGVPLTIYFTGTLLGLIPRIGLVAMAAASAHAFDLKSEKNTWVIVLGILATIFVVVMMAILGKRALERAIAAGRA